MLRSLAIALLLIVALTPDSAAQHSTDTTKVYAVVENFFKGLAERDTTLLASIMLIDGQYYAVSPADDSNTNIYPRTNRSFLNSLPNRTDVVVERMWDPTIIIDKYIATVWGPYDLYVNGEFSHCGVDAFTLVNADGEWRISSVSYSIDRAMETCTLHPEGPPPGAN